jgi:hypothetical protein
VLHRPIVAGLAKIAPEATATWWKTIVARLTMAWCSVFVMSISVWIVTGNGISNTQTQGADAYVDPLLNP